MKISTLVVLVLIAVAGGVMISTLSDAGTYDVFNAAYKNPGKEYHVIGSYVHENGQEYNPEINPNLFSFHMKDTLGTVSKVILHKEKPADFERAERIVIIGKAEGNEFHAREVLMKCPSKYNNDSPAKDNAENQ
jgi:cytochrome c-type biogenesis protein CcmE